MTTIDMLALLNCCGQALTGAREWVPATAPEIVPINSALDKIRTAMAELRVPEQGGVQMADPTTLQCVWEISGPFREHDSYILPHDDDTEWDQAREYAVDWLEEIMDQMDVDGPKLSIEVQLRTATEYDLATLRGECDDD